jgi:hypothetical protein
MGLPFRKSNSMSKTPLGLKPGSIGIELHKRGEHQSGADYQDKGERDL